MAASAAMTPAFWRSRRRYLAKCAVILAVILIGGSVFKRYCFIGLDPQTVTSTGYRWYLVFRHSMPTSAGQYVAFHVDARVEPRFHVGEVFLKRISCMYPCHVEETVDRLALNGTSVPPLNLEVVAKLGHRPEDYVSTRDLLPGQMFVTGSYPRSFDSRYWGDVSATQVIGRAYPLY